VLDFELATFNTDFFLLLCLSLRVALSSIRFLELATRQ